MPELSPVLKCKKKRKMLMLYGTFILLTLLAIVVEFAVKYAYAAVIYADIVKYADAVYRTEGNAIGIGIRKTLDDQSTYCWLLPIIFRVVPAIGRSSLEQYLRWLPYLFQILLPAVYWFLAAQKERNWHTVVWCIPIIFSIYQGIGCILAANYLPYLRISHYHGIPFFLEACLLVWLGVALRKKKPKMRKACGIILLVFCALSPFVSWLLEVLLYRLESPLSFIFSSHIFYDFPRIARSCWPLFKMFTMLMYALIAFFPPQQMVALHPNRTKRITIQPSTASSYLEAYKLNRKNGGK